MSTNEYEKSNVDDLRRSIIKAVTWRVIGSADTFVLSFIVIELFPQFLEPQSSTAIHSTAQTAGLIAVTELVTKLILYTVHEQIWTRIRWGRILKNGRLSETRSRTICKTIIWRIIAFLDTSFIAWIFTGSYITGITIGLLEVFTKLVIYYFHERVWLRIRFGQ